MSGGVDSSVAAYLLLKDGYEVIGATIRFFGDSSKMILDAKNVCDRLGIKHVVLDFSDDFKKYVIDDFINKYQDCMTPNPCVECNRYLKFKRLYKEANDLGIKYIATGHYAKALGGKIIRSDSLKDQTYFLYGIDKEIVPYIIFPLADYVDKEDIRDIAREIGLEVSEKKDSQDICFISDSYSAFLEENMSSKPIGGDFILKDGTVLGKHKGLIYYTIGQRKGLGIGYSKPLYVVGFDKLNNRVILGDEEDLYSSECLIDNINLLSEIPSEVLIKVRYAAPLAKAKVERIDHDRLRVIFDNKIKSVTKGQSLVMYDQSNQLIGGGIIKEVK